MTDGATGGSPKRIDDRMIFERTAALISLTLIYIWQEFMYQALDMNIGDTTYCISGLTVDRVPCAAWTATVRAIQQILNLEMNKEVKWQIKIYFNFYQTYFARSYKLQS